MDVLVEKIANDLKMRKNYAMIEKANLVRTDSFSALKPRKILDCRGTFYETV